MKYFYFSFADPKRPKGKQWLGAMYLEAENFYHAHQRSHDLGNPGGEIMSIELPSLDHIKPDYRERLLDEEELRSSSVDGDRGLNDMDGNEVPEGARS